MRYLNAKTVSSLSDLPLNAQRHYKNAYRILKLAYFGQIFLPQDEVSPVRSAEEFELAHQLVYREYLRKGFCAENPAEMFFNSFTLHPATVTLMARRNKRIVGTCAIISDTESRLPCDSIFKSEIDLLRAKEFRLVEIGSLATDHRLVGGQKHSLCSLRKISLVMNIFTGVLKYLYTLTDATHIIALVNPRHRYLYEIIGFEQFAPVRAYKNVEDNLAVPMLLDIQQYIDAQAEHLPTMYMLRSFGKLIPAQEYRVTALDIAFRAELNPVYFSQLSAIDANMLSVHYPLLKPILEYLVTNSKLISDLDKSKLLADHLQRTINKIRQLISNQLQST